MYPGPVKKLHCIHHGKEKLWSEFELKNTHRYLLLNGLMFYIPQESGARPTNDISFGFEIRPKLAVLWFEIYSTDHNEILHMSRQCNCRDVCKFSLWSVEHTLN